MFVVQVKWVRLIYIFTTKTFHDLKTEIQCYIDNSEYVTCDRDKNHQLKWQLICEKMSHGALV